MEDNPWTEALVAELRSLVGQRVPYGAIARRLGISRIAAIGKAKRLKLSSSCDIGGQDAAALPCVQPTVERVPAVPHLAFRCEPIPAAVSRDPLNLSIDDLKFFHCRYITNDDMQSPTYCGRDTVAGTSWCAFHLARVRLPVPPDDVPLVPSIARTTSPRN